MRSNQKRTDKFKIFLGSCSICKHDNVETVKHGATRYCILCLSDLAATRLKRNKDLQHTMGVIAKRLNRASKGAHIDIICASCILSPCSRDAYSCEYIVGLLSEDEEHKGERK
jgi:hypothetical protein